MNSDGTEQTELTKQNLNTEPAFSADGTKIAFWSQRDRDNEIYIMNLDGTEQTNLTNNQAGDVQPT